MGDSTTHTREHAETWQSYVPLRLFGHCLRHLLLIKQTKITSQEL